MTNAQMTLKATVVSIFLDTFDTLENIFSALSVSKKDERVIRVSIEEDFVNSLK